MRGRRRLGRARVFVCKWAFQGLIDGCLFRSVVSSRARGVNLFLLRVGAVETVNFVIKPGDVLIHIICNHGNIEPTFINFTSARGC